MFFKYKQQSLKKITAIALAVLFLDQIVKFVIVKNIFFTIDIYKNPNALFGLPVDFKLIFVLFIIFILYFILFKKTKSYAINSIYLIAFGLVFGGIIGNLTDRFFYGHIIDYINLCNLFVFNIADLSICFGVLLLSWKILGK